MSEAERISAIITTYVAGSGSQIDALLVAHDLYQPRMDKMSKQARLSMGLDIARQRGILETVLASAENRPELAGVPHHKESKAIRMANRKIFISHAKEDAPLVEALVNLLRLGSEANRDEIVCTSLEGMRPPAGVRFVDWIKDQLADAGLVVEVITPAYWESQFCVCELGAQWGLGLDAHPLLAPGVDYEDLKAVLTGVQAGKLDKSGDLDDLHDRVGKVVARTQSTANWSKERDRFLDGLPGVMREIPGATTVPLAEFKALEGELEAARSALTEREAEATRLRAALAAASSGAPRGVVAAALASGEDSEFQVLVDMAREAQRRLPFVVRQAMWQRLGSRDGGPYRPAPDEWEDVQVEVDNVRLRVDSDDLVWLEEDDEDVEAAVEAIEALMEAEVPDGFAERFRDQHGMKFNMRNRRVWDALRLM